jgi:hypothetical protein
MARRLNWEKRAFDLKPKRALKDEEEFRKTDWAARFIARAEQSPRVRPHHHRKAAAVAKREADADRQRDRASANRAVREKPPWED